MSSFLHLPPAIPRQRRRFSRLQPLHGLHPLHRLQGDSQPYRPDIGPQILAPFDASTSDGTDAIETLTEIDEGTYQGVPTTPEQKMYGIHHVTFPRGVPNWENIDQDNYALLPAIGSTVTIISYVVPPGRNGIIYKVGNNFVGGGWVEGTGDVIWRILVDNTPPPGATSYDTILASLGNPASPTEIAGFRIFENQVLTLVAFNNPGGPNGGVVVAGQRVGARFCGWNYPTDIEESDIWI